MEKYSWDTITSFEDAITCVSIINNSENLERTISARKKQEKEIAGDL